MFGLCIVFGGFILQVSNASKGNFKISYKVQKIVNNFLGELYLVLEYKLKKKISWL